MPKKTNNRKAIQARKRAEATAIQRRATRNSRHNLQVRIGRRDPGLTFDDIDRIFNEMEMPTDLRFR